MRDYICVWMIVHESVCRMRVYMSVLVSLRSLYFCLLGKYMSLDVHVYMEKVHICMFITMNACMRPISCPSNCVFRRPYKLTWC